MGRDLLDQGANQDFDLISNRADRLQGAPCRVGHLPVQVPLARKIGADIPAPHRDDDIAILHRFSGEDLRDRCEEAGCVPAERTSIAPWVYPYRVSSGIPLS